MSTIILAHGLFGFGHLLPGFLEFLPSVHYFNGVADHLRKQNHTVLEPQVNPIGSIQGRGEQLADSILEQTSAGDRLHILGHSMGGLDARYAIAHSKAVADRVATLVTIGTPHRGSPVADAFVKGSGDVFEVIPESLRRELEHTAGAVHDLSTEFCVQFDKDTPDHAQIRYINVAGDASKAGNELFLMELAAKIGKITGELNDGVVTKSSALRAHNEHLEDWPVDHIGEIGWSTALLNPSSAGKAMADHLGRYDRIVKLCTAAN